MTEELKQIVETNASLIKQLREALDNSNVWAVERQRYMDFYHNRLSEEAAFNKLPWYKKMIYKFRV